MNMLKNEKGAILITMLLLMVIITLIGIIAINISNVDIQISGQTKRVSKAFEGAEAGVELAVPVIENVLADGTFPSVPSGITLDTANLGTEINGGSDYNTDKPSDATPDVKISDLNGVEVKVDIDRLYTFIIPGGALEFASGYEGIGAGAAGGGVGVLYRIDSQGSM